MKNPSIMFSADGIRGIADKWPLTTAGLSLLGEALAYFINQSNVNPVVVLGRDTRPSGQRFADVLSRSLSVNGAEIIDLGIAPTPVVAYITKKLQANLGIIISASHNPVKYNGVKLVNSNGLRLSVEDENEIEKLLIGADIRSASIKKIGQKVKDPRLIEVYLNDHIAELGKDCLKGLKIVVDCANGAVSLTAEKLFVGLGANVKVINGDLSGTYHINERCGSEYVRQDPRELIQILQKFGADYGFAFDGDGDRVVVADRAGNFFNGDDLLFVLATYYSKNRKLRKQAVVTTEFSNQGLIRSLKCSKIETVITPNGDKHLEAEIRTKNYLLGGEQVGNIIINDGMHGSADSLYAISLLCKILTAAQTTLETATLKFKKYPQILASIHSHKQIGQNAMDEIIKVVKAQCTLGASTRILSWRSSTEPGMYNIMVEGALSEDIEKVQRAAVLLSEYIQGTKQKTHINIIDLSSRKRL